MPSQPPRTVSAPRGGAEASARPQMISPASETQSAPALRITSFPQLVALSAEKRDLLTKGALEACKQAAERQPGPWTTLALARAQALAGDRASATANMASLATQSDLFVSGYDRAAVYEALGRTDDAFAALEEAYQSRAEWMSYLQIDPQMDALRRDQRYTTLLKGMGF